METTTKKNEKQILALATKLEKELKLYSVYSSQRIDLAKVHNLNEKDLENLDKVFKDLRSKDTLSHKMETGSEIYSRYGSFTGIKKNRDQIEKDYCISFVQYKEIVSLYKKDLKQKIEDLASDIKDRVFTYGNILTAVFPLLEKDKDFQYLCNFVKLHFDKVTDFVTTYYSYIDPISKDLLIPKTAVYIPEDKKEDPVIYKYFAVKKLTDTSAVSVLKNSLNNLKRDIKNGFKTTYKGWNNNYTSGSIIGVYKLEFSEDLQKYVYGDPVTEFRKDLDLYDLETLGQINNSLKK